MAISTQVQLNGIDYIMKAFLGVMVLGILLSGNVCAENLGDSKTVNDYVNDDYSIVSVEIISKGTIAYTLRSKKFRRNNSSKNPLVVTCIYSSREQQTICIKP